MRRSQAPSLRTTTKPIISNVLKEKPIENKIEPAKNPVRSTDEILNLVLGSTLNDNEQDHSRTGVNENIKEADLTVNSDSKNSIIKSYNVVYGKPSTKKHKTWDDNGILDVYQDRAVLKDEEGKTTIGSISLSLSKFRELEEGSRIFIGGKEVELIDLVDPNISSVKVQSNPSFLKLKSSCLNNNFKRVTSTQVSLNEDTNDECSFNEVDVSSSTKEGFNPIVNYQNADTDAVRRIFNVVFGKQSKKKHKTWDENGTLEIHEKFATLKDETGKKIGSVQITKSKPLSEGSRIFVGSKEVELIDLVEEPVAKKPKMDQSPVKETFKIKKIEMKKKFVNPALRNPLHKNFDGFILPEPNAEHQWYFNKENLPVTPVFVDTSISKKLRQHQQVGLTFLYECIMGFKENSLTGAILADEMGLGKTLQCIALIWTLLKRGPYGNKPVIKRVLIVTPSSLTMNWYNEFIKWLGRERLAPYVVDQNKKPSGLNNCPVMIISYEMFVRCHEEVNKFKFDLLVCDEGHRLKNSNIRTTQLLNQLDCDKRILLTGTPIQNDLQEFYALVDFVNPNVLGSSTEFRKTFEDPILASRQPNADEEILSKGEEAAQELNRRTSLFLLRRTKEILDKYLPSKHEVVVFCKPTEIQRNLYNSIVDSLMVAKDFSGFCDGVAHLGVISTLRKICNHPGLVKKEDEDEFEKESITGEVLNEFPDLDKQISPEDSGKLMLVLNFLQELQQTRPKERVVLVSNSTKALDVIAEMLDSLKFTSCRLDGSTPASQRSSIVDRFNSFGSNIFVFLLSAKAGGVGLNLTGASRLILFDSDWNPATDLQAMSRIWRDGQKHSVYIYRFLTTGTIEEKIYQRQITKQGLCDGIVDPQSFRSIKLSKEELKELFMPCEVLDECYTHYSLSCSCSRNGEIPMTAEEDEEERSCQLGKQSSSVLKISELFHWEHHGVPINSDILSELSLKSSEDLITFIFRNSTN